MMTCESGIRTEQIKILYTIPIRMHNHGGRRLTMNRFAHSEQFMMNLQFRFRWLNELMPIEKLSEITACALQSNE